MNSQENYLMPNEEFIYKLFNCVFIKQEDEHHKIDSNFSYNDKNFDYMKEHYHDYTINELYEILLIYELSFDFKTYGNMFNSYERHANRVRYVIDTISFFLNSKNTPSPNVSFNFNKNNTVKKFTFGKGPQITTAYDFSNLEGDEF